MSSSATEGVLLVSLYIFIDFGLDRNLKKKKKIKMAAEFKMAAKPMSLPQSVNFFLLVKKN
jgi:hypothetical protein